VDTTVLFDVSDSVAGSAIEQLRRSVIDLRRDIRPPDRLRLVALNHRVGRLFDLDTPTAAADAAIALVRPGGSSAVFDGLAVALASGGTPGRRQFIVLFSDGKDSASITTPDTLLEVARRTTPTVSVVLSSSARSATDRLYAELAAETGGLVVSLLPSDTLGGNLRRAFDQFRSSYVLTYVPTGVVRTGVHTIDVRVNREAVDVRARRGYVVR
jgi:Mg-chelatase subunit ChlD